MKIYIVIELNKEKTPCIIGAFKNKTEAEKEAYKTNEFWRNIKEIELK